MASAEFEKLRKVLKPGLAVPGDPPELVREKMHRVHPTHVPDDASVERTTLGGVPAAWVSTPASDGSPLVVLHVHGGAFVSTTIDHYIPYASSISREARARVCVFEYRLAPEHRFPAALDDTLAVYRAQLASGLAPGRIAISGDSCGGGIGLALLLRLRDGGLSLPAAFAGFTPWFDLEMAGDSARNPVGIDPYVDPDWIRARGRDYVGPRGDPRDPLASPIHADLSGLPPMLLQVGQVDITRDDSTRLAARAARDGVAVSLEAWPEMIHGFHGLAELIPEGREALRLAGDYLHQKIA